MMFGVPPGTAILGDGRNLLLPPGITEEDRCHIAAHKHEICYRLRTIQMDSAGFYTQLPETILKELQAAQWIAVDLQVTAATRYCEPIRVTKTTAIGRVEWQAFRAAHPTATVSTVPRPRVLAVYTQPLGHLAWDLDTLTQEDRRMLFEAVLAGKIVVGHDLGRDFAWLFGETAARPDSVIDIMILFRQMRPTVLLRPYRWAGFSEDGKQSYAADILRKFPRPCGNIEYLAACAEFSPPDAAFNSPSTWCPSILTPDHFTHTRSKIDLVLQLLRFLFADPPLSRVPELLREKCSWYLPFQVATVRLAEAHVRGVTFDSGAAASLKNELLAEIENSANALASYEDFVELKDQLSNPCAGLTEQIRRALSAHAGKNGVSLPLSRSRNVDRRSQQAAAAGGASAWLHVDHLQSSKKGLATVDEYCNAAGRCGRLHSLFSFDTQTGRASSKEPGLQKVPRDARFRHLFKAGPDHLILACDYGHIEVSIAASLANRAIEDLRRRVQSQENSWFLQQVRKGVHHSKRARQLHGGWNSDQGDASERGALIASAAKVVLGRSTQIMTEALQRHIDPHLVTAVDFARRNKSFAFEGHPLHWVSSLDQHAKRELKETLRLERQKAKAANFGLLYGMTDKGLYQSGTRNFGLDWTLEEASAARQAWFHLYPEFEIWHEWTRYCQSQKSKREKWRMWGSGEEKSMLVVPRYDVRVYKSTTLTGRPIAVLNELSAALNYQAQGTGADILARAIARLPHEVAAMMLLSVHDELVFEVPTRSVASIKTIVETTMTTAAAEVLGGLIPVVVESSFGKTWSKEIARQSSYRPDFLPSREPSDSEAP